MSKVFDVYYCYYDIKEGTTEIRFNKQTTTIKGLNVLTEVNLSRNSIVYINHLSLVERVYTGGIRNGSRFERTDRTKKYDLEYRYGNVIFRNIKAFTSGNEEKVIKKMYKGKSMTEAIQLYLTSINKNGKPQWTIASASKKNFYEDIKDELWAETKKNKNYYYDIKHYNDMMTGSKKGCLKETKCYKTNVGKRDKKSAYPSVLVSDNKFPIGKLICSQNINKQYTKLYVECALAEGNWCKVVLENKIDGFEEYFDEDYNKTAVEYYDILDMIESNKFDEFIDAIETATFYTTTKTDYLPKVFRDKIIELFVTKENYDHDSVEYYFQKLALNLLYGKGMQKYDFNDIIKVQDHYRGRGDNYLKPEMSLHCTAAVRYEIKKAIRAMGEQDDYYHDTDGIIFNDTNDNQAYFEQENVKILDKLEQAGYSRDLKLGIWADEGHFDDLLVIAPKQYITRSGDKFDLTLAGVKENVQDIILSELLVDPENALKFSYENGIILYYPVFVDCGDNVFKEVFIPDLIKFD